MIVAICVGSSCHLKGSYEIVKLLEKEVKERNLDVQVNLCGAFCIGKCNRDGVTVQVDDIVYAGVTVENFNEFFNDKILSQLE